jgi:hypothetical protein
LPASKLRAIQEAHELISISNLLPISAVGNLFIGAIFSQSFACGIIEVLNPILARLNLSEASPVVVVNIFNHINQKIHAFWPSIEDKPCLQLLTLPKKVLGYKI